MNMKLWTITRLLVGLVLASLSWQIHSENVACKRIKELYVSGTVNKYSVAFKQGGIDNVDHDLVYEFSFNKKNAKGQLAADCGNGADAECQLTLTVNNAAISNFTLPATIRLINVDSAIYIVNGVIISPKNNVKFEEFLVNEVSPNGIKQICP